MTEVLTIVLPSVTRWPLKIPVYVLFTKKMKALLLPEKLDWMLHRANMFSL